MIACHPRGRRCSDARDYHVEMRPCCRGHLRTVMAVLVDLLEGAGVRYWADYGTLLGAVRNPLTSWADYPWLPQEGRETSGPAAGIIPHDKDADLGALFEDWAIYRDEVRPKLIERGFYVKLDESKPYSKIRISFHNHTNVDLFFWIEREDGTLFRHRYAKVDACKGREFPKGMLFPLSTVEWEGMTLPAPRDPEAFLAMRYGPGWRTPIPANNDGVPR